MLGDCHPPRCLPPTTPVESSTPPPAPSSTAFLSPNAFSPSATRSPSVIPPSSFFPKPPQPPKAAPSNSTSTPPSVSPPSNSSPTISPTCNPNLSRLFPQPSASRALFPLFSKSAPPLAPCATWTPCNGNSSPCSST